MILLVGPSASGKTEIGKILSKKFGYEKLITYTTREKRFNEINDIDYHFISRESFINQMNNNFYFETIFYNNNFYGTAKEDIKDNKYLIVDSLGLKKYAKSNYFVVSFFLSASEDCRLKRMLNRHDLIEDIKTRLEIDSIHFNQETIKEIDFQINTEDYLEEDIALFIHQTYVECLKNKK